MNRGSLSNLIEGFFGNSVQPVIKATFTEYLWNKIKVELEEAEDRGYWRGKDAGYKEAQAEFGPPF